MGILKKEREFYATSIRITYKNKYGGIEVIYFDELFDLIDFIKTIDKINKKR